VRRVFPLNDVIVEHFLTSTVARFAAQLRVFIEMTATTSQVSAMQFNGQLCRLVDNIDVFTLLKVCAVLITKSAD
jgi:hypothetical protein